MSITIDMMQYFIDTDQCKPDKLAQYFGKHWTKTGQLYCIPSPYDCYPDIYIDTKCGNILHEFALDEGGFYQTAAYKDGFVFYFPHGNLDTSHIFGKEIIAYQFRHGPYHVQQNKIRYKGSYEDEYIKIEDLCCDINRLHTKKIYWGSETYGGDIFIKHVRIIDKKTGKVYTLDKRIPDKFVRMKNGFYDRRRMKLYSPGDYNPIRSVRTYEQIINQLAPFPYYPSHRTVKEINRIEQTRQKYMNVLTNPVEVLSLSSKPVIQLFTAAEILELQPSFDDIVLSRPDKITFGRKPHK